MGAYTYTVTYFRISSEFVELHNFFFLLQYGNTPVKLAAEKGNISVVKLLMEKGADITIADKVR